MDTIQTNPLKISNINELTDTEVDELLEGIRERRLKPVRVYEEMLKMKSEAKKVQLEEALTKQLAIFEKSLATVDKALNTLENRARKLRGIKLEIDAS